MHVRITESAANAFRHTERVSFPLVSFQKRLKEPTTEAPEHTQRTRESSKLTLKGLPQGRLFLTAALKRFREKAISISQKDIYNV